MYILEIQIVINKHKINQENLKVLTPGLLGFWQMKILKILKEIYMNED